MKQERVMFILDLKQATPRWTSYIEELALKGYQIDLVISYSGKIEFSEQILRLKNFNIHYAPFISLYGRNRILTKVLRMIESFPKEPKGFLSRYDKLASGALIKKAEALFTKNNYHSLISSSSPLYCHVAANKLRQKYQFIWIADYRDLWSMNHASKKHNPKQMDFERNLISTADACITVSEGFRRDLRKIYFGPCHVIFNGFKAINQTSEILYEKHCIIEYTGQIYREYHDIIKFVEYLDLAKDFSLNNISINFSGSSGFFLQKYYREKHLKVPKFINNIGYLTNHDVISRQKSANFLLFLNWSSEDDKGVILSKIYEYISSGVPIIVFGKTKNVEIERILTSSGYSLQLNTQRDVDDFLQKYREKKLVLPPRNLEFIRQFQYSNQAKTLSALLENYTIERKSVIF
jgi:hypothetical protein